MRRGEENDRENEIAPPPGSPQLSGGRRSSLEARGGTFLTPTDSRLCGYYHVVAYTARGVRLRFAEDGYQEVSTSGRLVRRV